MTPPSPARSDVTRFLRRCGASRERPILLLVLLLLSTGVLAAEERALDIAALGAPSFESFSQRDGLPNGVITAIGVDNEGAAIAASPAGLFRFIGHRWQQQVGVEHGTVYRRFLLDQHGALWTSANDKDAGYYDKRGWHFLTPQNGLPANDVYRVSETQDASGRRHLWMLTSTHGLFERRGRIWIADPGNRFLPGHGFLTAMATTTRLFGERRQWIGGGDAGVWYRREGDVQWHPLLAKELQPSGIEDLQSSEDVTGESLWISAFGQGVYRISDRGVRRWSSASRELPTNNVYGMTIDPDPQRGPTVWVGSRSGLIRVRGDSAETFDRRYGLPSDQIRATFLWRSPDGEKILWIATEAGVARAVFTPARWQTASLMGSGAVGVFGVLVDNGPRGERLWVASNRDGLGLYEDGTWRRFTSATGMPGDNFRMVKHATDLRGEDALWIGLEPGYLLRADAGPKFTTISTPWPHELGQVPLDILSRHFDGKRELWVATRRFGIYRWRDDGWTAYGLPGSKDEWRAVSLAEQIDASGRSWIWAGTNQGVARFDGCDWTIIHLPGLTASDVYGLSFPQQLGAKQVLWIGSALGGLNRLDVTNPQAPLVLSSDELPPVIDVTVYTATRDHEGRIYLATNNGVQRLTPRRTATGMGWSSVAFRRQEGMVHEECNANAQFVDVHDRFWTGTLGGLTVYEPATRAPGRPKQLRLVEVMVDGKGVPATALRLSPQVRELRVEYTLQSWQREGETRYRTQIAGFEPSPGAWTAQPERVIPSLPPGHYRLHVEARDYAGTPAATPLEIPFEVIPAWWQTRLARAAAILGFLLFFAGGAQWRTRVLRAQKKHLASEVALRTEQLNVANARLVELSYTDALTGLANRRRFHEYLRIMLGSEGTNSRPRTCSLAFIDVDRFKEFNDRFGHPAGDEALRIVAGSLLAVAPSTALVARYGGEEFACILPDTSPDEAVNIADRMRLTIRQRPIAIPGGDEVAHTTISAGIATTSLTNEGDIHELLRRADAALYRAKSDGRDCVRT